MSPLKSLTSLASFDHGDLVQLPSGEIVRWQDGDHPPIGTDRGWYCHPQDAAGNYTAAGWAAADRTVKTIDEMWTHASLLGNIQGLDQTTNPWWHGGLVAPNGKQAIPSWLTKLDTEELARDVSIARHRLADMGYPADKLALATTSVPFGDRALMLQDHLRCAAECLLGGELKIAFRYYVKAMAVDVVPDSRSADALWHIQRVIEDVLDRLDERVLLSASLRKVVKP